MGSRKARGSLRNLSSFMKVKNNDNIGISDNPPLPKNTHKRIYSVHLRHIVPKVSE